MIAVALSIVALAAAPKPTSRTAAHQALHDQCVLYAANPKNPWALAHGITGVGRAFAASDGRRAADVIVRDFVRRDADGGFSFDRFAADGTPVEPHMNLQPKTLVLSGLPLSERFAVDGGTVTLGQLVEDAKRDFRLPANETEWRDAAWTLDLLSAVLKPKAATFKNGAGATIDFNAVMDQALGYLETAQAELAAGMDRNQVQVDKKKQGIYAHTCGGLHLFQAVASWARFPEVKKRWSPRFDKQVKVLFYRLRSEARQYDAALTALPQHELAILVQMVKFYGHFLESTGRLKTENRFKPDAAQTIVINEAKVRLERAVQGLEKIRAFDRMGELQKTQPQVYLDLIGDSCHATHGWDYWR